MHWLCKFSLCKINSNSLEGAELLALFPGDDLYGGVGQSQGCHQATVILRVESVQPGAVTQADLTEVRGAGPAVRDDGPANNLPSLQVNHGQVLVLVVHTGQQKHCEPRPDCEQLPNLLVDVDALNNFTRIGIQEDNVSVPDGLGVEHWHLPDEGNSSAIKMQARSEEE